MKIKRQKPEDAQTERYIIISMIMSENICRSLKHMYDNKFFQSKITKTVADWTMEFFEKYDDSPKQEIQSIFNMKSKAGKIEPDLEEELEKFLENLSEEYEDWEFFNEQYYLELGQKYFKKRSFIILSDNIKEAAEENDVDEAEKRYSNFTKVQEQMDTSRKLFDESGVEDLRLSVQNKPPYLFRMPGAVGEIIGPIERETFIGVLGREKIGKTFNLMNFGVNAARQGLNVAVIETGDLTQDQLDQRFFSYFTKKVAKPDDVGYHYVPVMDCLYNQMGMCDRVDSEAVVRNDEKIGLIFDDKIDLEDKERIEDHQRCIKCWRDRKTRPKFRGSIWWEYKYVDMWSWKEAKQKAKKFSKKFKGQIVTEAFAMNTVKASDIRDWCINKQKQEGFVPDLLIIDYPDILLPEKSNDQYRHQENEKWMVLRQISQEFHNCVLVTTQADAKSYNKDTLQLDNYSEDKRKYGHTTHFMALNQNEHEEQFGCTRMSTLLLRENSMKIGRQATLLQDLSTARFCTASFFGRVPNLNKSK